MVFELGTPSTAVRWHSVFCGEQESLFLPYVCMYVGMQVFISLLLGWAYGFIFSCFIIILYLLLYFGAEIVADLASGNSQLPCLCNIPPISFDHSLTGLSFFRLILYFLSQPWNPSFLKVLWFLLLGNGIRNQVVGATTMGFNFMFFFSLKTWLKYNKMITSFKKKKKPWEFLGGNKVIWLY